MSASLFCTAGVGLEQQWGGREGGQLEWSGCERGVVGRREVRGGVGLAT